MSLAEKFQITIPAKPEDGHEWTSFASARESGAPVTQSNETPPGYSLSNKNAWAQGFGGDTDVTGDVEPKSLREGYRRRELKATDDQYHGEHCDLFYGEAEDEDGNVGFAERNNYLDRI